MQCVLKPTVDTCMFSMVTQVFPYQMRFSIEQKEYKKPDICDPLCIFSFLCWIILFSTVVSFLSVFSFCSLQSTPWGFFQTGMQHIHPFRGLSQNTTHHYCHSLFQSCCYILKTLRAGVVLIPDYSPAQFIKQGQTPLNPLYIKYYNITCPEMTDAAFSPEFRVYLQSLCQHLGSHVPHGVPTDIQAGERGVAPKRVQHDGQITL